jgi:hypothetical protein
MSYFDGYMNLRGERTPGILGAGQPARFDRLHAGWMTATSDLWWVAELLADIRHRPLLTAAMTRRLSIVDRRSRTAALVGYRAH